MIWCWARTWKRSVLFDESHRWFGKRWRLRPDLEVLQGRSTYEAYTCSIKASTLALWVDCLRKLQDLSLSPVFTKSSIGVNCESQTPIATTLAKKIETTARTWHRRVICRACTRLCRACVPVSIFFGQGSKSETYCNRRKFRTRFHFVYFVLLVEVRKLVAYESHARIPVLGRRPRCTKIYRVRKFASARVRNFYAYENSCDYSTMKQVENLNTQKKVSTNLVTSHHLVAIISSSCMWSSKVIL